MEGVARCLLGSFFLPALAFRKVSAPFNQIVCCELRAVLTASHRSGMSSSESLLMAQIMGYKM
jgi:hypothetical protein